MTRRFSNADDLAEALVEEVGKDIVLGMPVGLGKAPHVVNALCSKAAADPSIRLTIFTALSLEAPKASSELEERFVAPLAKRLFEGWPELAYVRAIRDRSLPRNIHVREFYFRPAAFLGNPIAQKTYTSVNYSQVADELIMLGVNVIAQIVSERPESPATWSLSCNPEVTLDLMPYIEDCRRQGKPVALVAQVNRNLPFMTRDAEVRRDVFDFALDDDAVQFPLFGIPNRPVEPSDYALAMHVASLVRDGGTIQLGIGSLSDAVAHCLKLRQKNPGVFRQVYERLPGGGRSVRRRVLPMACAPFSQGLYACSELVSDALFSLFVGDIVRRPADECDATVLHGGFFLGSAGFYEALRALPEARRQLINMTRISFVNTLYGDEQRKRAQRKNALFVNETMMVTLLGAAVSDALEDGRVVSGVGGQFDFVAMSHALHDGESVLMVKSRRGSGRRAVSNIRWSYGHVTVPRHHRDIFVSEYGIAATRGQPDHYVVEALMNIADSEFQPGLLSAARSHGKVDKDYSIPGDACDNRPEILESIFADPEVAPWFPAFPLGTDLTETEQDLAAALSWLKAETRTPAGRLRRIGAALLRQRGAAHHACLERLGLDAPTGIGERIMARLVADALERSQA